MREVILRLVDVPVARILVLAGFIFLLVGILGKIEGKIEPGTFGRISSALLGVLLLGIGIFMQYTELKYAEIYDTPPKTQITQAAAPQNASSSPGAAADIAATAIKVVSGTYGRNCNAKAGNATELIAKTCDGLSSCDFIVDAAALADPAPNCSKDFAAEWKCGDGNAIYSAALSGLTGKNDRLRLNCAS